MIYLDHAATSPLLPEVKQAMTEAMEELLGNAAALHAPGYLARQYVEKARKTVAKLINAKPQEIIFTSGASEGNNAVMHTFEGKNIAISAFEHPSVTVPAYKLAKDVTEINSAFFRDFPQVTTEAKRRTPVTTGGADACPVKCDIYSIQLANHEIGTVFPIAKLAKQAHQQGAYFHTDATQAIGKMPIDVKKLGVDYLTFSAHKIGGPTGVGVLYIKKNAPFKPLVCGGHQEDDRRSGTHNTIGIVGLGAAANHIMTENTPALYEKNIRPLRDLFEKRVLREIKGSKINMHKDLKRLANLSNISFKGAEGESIQLQLDNQGIIVSTGSACAAADGQPSSVLMALHNDAEVAHSSVRFSFGLETTKKDIETMMDILPDVIKKLQGISTI